MAEEWRKIYDDYGTPRELEHIIDEYMFIFPDSFYLTIFDRIEEGKRYIEDGHVIHNLREVGGTNPRYSMNLPFEVKKQIIDDHFMKFLPELQFIFTLAYDPEIGIAATHDVVADRLLYEAVVQFYVWLIEFDNLFGVPVHIGDQFIDDWNTFYLDKLIYQYSDYLFAVNTHS